MKINKIKKTSIVLLLLTMTLVLAGCGHSGANDYGYKDFSKYVKVGNYKDLDYKIEKAEITDEEVQLQIQNILQSAQTVNEITEGVLTEKDTVNISYTCKVDGKDYNSENGDYYTLDLSNSTLIKGFAEGLVGKNIGDTETLNLTFPKNYENKNLAEKDAVFIVTINFKSVVTIPKYDEAFIKENSDYNTKEEYEKYVKESMLAERNASNEAEALNNLLYEVINNSEIIEYPKNKLEDTKKAEIKTYEQLANMYDMEYEDFILEQIGFSLKDFDKQMDDYAKLMVKQNLVVYAIAKEENLKVSDKEYQELIDTTLEESGLDEEGFKETNDGNSVEDYVIRLDLSSNLLKEKVVERMIKYAK